MYYMDYTNLVSGIDDSMQAHRTRVGIGASMWGYPHLELDLCVDNAQLHESDVT